MKTTMKILPLLFGVMLFFTQCEKEAEIDGSVNAEAFMTLKAGEVECNFAEQILWAGAGRNNTDNGTDVGTVTAEVDGNMLTVVYDVVSPWHGVEYHLWVGNSLGGIPNNAAPGLFPESGSASYLINLDDLGFTQNDPIYIAAHAVVRKGGGIEGLETLLPATVDFSVLANDPDSYIEIDVTSEGILNGTHEAWCIDPLLEINETSYTSVSVYSSYAETPTGSDYIDDLLENNASELAKINWILNNVGYPTYHSDNVQIAIWQLLGYEGPDEEGEGGDYGVYDDFDQLVVNAILDLAADQGSFVPECGMYMGIILYKEGNLQPIIIPYMVTCGDEETAWAEGQYNFIDEKIARKWGWIFALTYCE